MNARALIPSVLCVLGACRGPAPLQDDPLLTATPACFAQIAEALSDDAMDGRGVGTAGLDAAADLIQARLEALRLDGPYRQAFEATTGVSLGDGNALTSGTLGEDFTPLGFSSSGGFEGDLVLAGYGIRAEALGYDDYDGLDVRGKVVLAMRYEPGERDDASPFDGKNPSRYSDLRYKAMRAREAGAAALLLVNPPVDDDPDKLPALRTDGPESHAGLPVLQVTRDWVRRVVGDAALDEVYRAIEADYRPHSRGVGVKIRGAAAVEPSTAAVENVVGFWPGAGTLAEEVVVVGAHYDHLGHGGRGSMRPGEHEVHNGADDNASGVAAMLCAVGDLLVRPPQGNRRALLAIAFAAEEIGLGGSGHYVNAPRAPLEDTVAMVNLDMVGRVREGRLFALGADSAPEWSGWLAAAAPSGLTVEGSGDGYGPSDHMSFYAREVPVVHFFSGSHDAYHTPDDDFETLNVEGGAQVASLTASLLRTLLTTPEGPTYTKSTDGPRLAGDSRGYGAYLGTIPDYTTMGATEGGVKLSGVREGGPAALAGLLAGDVIVGMAGREVQNLYDMTFVLRDHKPGDTIEIVVLRGEARHTMPATLGRRGEEPSGAHHAPAWAPKAGQDASALHDPREVHLADLRQLTFEGENAEAYWSPDGKKLIFQRSTDGACDQQYVIDLDTGETTRISSGKGRTTCGYFAWPGGERVIYATTEGGDAACPAPPDRSKGYVWPLYDTYDLVWQDVAGGDPVPFLPSPAYDAEATVCMQDGRVLFTSTRDGDLDLYVANADGSGLKRLTSEPGYDGGAFFTPDCRHIVWRASRPQGEALDAYRALLAEGLVRPSALELFWMDADGGNVRQLTDNGAANFAPYPTPDGEGVLFSSNLGGSPREFDIHRVALDGGAIAQITFAPEFDGFPMFSPDGTWLVFASNRGGAKPGDTNLFLARWVP